MVHLLRYSKQQVIADGNPYLRIDRILACPVEGLDVKMMFNPLKETLHLPTLPIEFRNGQVRVCEVVSQKPVNVTCRIVFIDHHAECFRIPFGSLLTSQPDDRVTEDACAFINQSFFLDLILHVVFGSCHEEGLLPMEVIKQLVKIYIAFVHKVVITRLYGNQAHHLRIMNSGFCQMDKRGERSTQVEQSVHLHTTLVMMEASPRTKLKAELDGAAVESIYDTINIKSGRLILIQVASPRYEHQAEVSIDMPILSLIDVSKRGTLDIFDARGVQIGGQSHQRGINAAETVLMCKLSKTHHHKLISAFEPDGMSIAVVSLYALVEFISWYERHDLSEYGLSLIHDFCLLQYNLQKYKIKSRKINIRVNH